MTDKKGTFYFFTGLAGAGKTTIGGLFYRRQKGKRNDILLFDGDATRNVSGERDYSTPSNAFASVCAVVEDVVFGFSSVSKSISLSNNLKIRLVIINRFSII